MDKTIDDHQNGSFTVINIDKGFLVTVILMSVFYYCFVGFDEEAIFTGFATKND